MKSAFLPKSNTTPSPESPTWTLLLVDDEGMVLRGLKRTLKHETYQIIMANGATDALAHLEKQDVHLIISDYQMPGQSGLEFLTTVRERWPETVRILLTGTSDIKTVMKAVEDGTLFKFIAKPFISDDLRVTVRRSLEQYQLKREVKMLQDKNKEQQSRIKSFSSVMQHERGMLGKILLRQKIITETQYREALAEQAKTKDLMYVVLQRLEFADAKQIQECLEDSLGLYTVNIQSATISAEAVSLIPFEYCLENLVLPFGFRDGVLDVAMADPSDVIKRDGLESLVGVRLNVFIANGIDLLKQIRTAYGREISDRQEVDIHDAQPLKANDGTLIKFDVQDNQSTQSLENLIVEANAPSVVEVVNSILNEALERGASDIHFSPKSEHILVQYRINGMLQERIKLPSTMQNNLVSRIKILAELDISERRLPQDGRVAMQAGNRILDLRVACLPLLQGEKVVIRLLDRHAAVGRVKDLGFDAVNLERISLAACQPQGLIVCTGPTGSGKTTTLYSLLKEHLTPERAYGTIEDPVEYLLEEAAQVHVRAKIGMKFSVALRSMLRQDPDVILIGEMRDEETSQIAFQAALTGHLVLSTLHTNDSVGAISRIQNLGVPPYMIAPALKCVIAQRLVRAVCNACVEHEAPNPSLIATLRLDAKEWESVPKVKGCDECDDMGYTARLGVFEVLQVSEELKELIYDKAKEFEMGRMARQQGMKTLLEDALEKVASGRTTLEEVLRIVGPQVEPGQDCEQCSEFLPYIYNVCPMCGWQRRIICKSCSAILQKDWKHCPTCGEHETKA